MSLTLDLAAYLKARPHQWIDGRELAGIAGAYAWRTRLSDCRALGMTIANRQERRVSATGKRFTVSFYQYQPPAATLLDLLDATHTSV